MIELVTDGQRIWAQDPESREKLAAGCYGSEGALEPEEALYVIEFQNGVCADSRTGEVLDFPALAARFLKQRPRLLVEFAAYRDWRDRGLVVRRLGAERGSAQAIKSYPAKPLAGIPSAALRWLGGSAVADAKELFSQFWFGQRGVYKQERGELLTLDWLETAFLAKHAGCRVADAAGKQLSANDILARAGHEYARQLFEVYEDWRLRGYVVKTGFKFGTHFRIYFPGARPKLFDAGSGTTKKPASGQEWSHSKHVLHVFPKEQRLLVSEWARAVRVAHGVRKTFLLAIPELTERDRAAYPAEFVAWRRKKKGSDWIRETPADPARYLHVPIGEDERIGGLELATLLRQAAERGLELLLAIVDRETAITYYALKRIELPGSAQAYYEIEWMKP